ncbi:MAG: hypothetical protein ACE367_02705 [Acidimicrobiales bacterium]
MAGDPRPDIGGGGPWSTLERWIAEGAVDEAARARARRGWLREQAAASTSFVAVLADLADRGRPVLVHGTTGTRHRGRIAGLGADFVALTTDHGSLVLVAHHAIAAVRSEPGDRPMRSMRAPELGLSLTQVLAELGEDRPRVAIATAGSAQIAGELVSVGVDVATVRLDGDARATVYVPLDAVCEVMRPAR